MVWLYPQFLWALFALLVPIAIHLFNFRRYKRIEFSNVRLLSQINRQTKSGNQLKKYLILASRLLAFTCLVLAFVQPVIKKDNTSLENGKTSISLFIDNSYSMNLSGEEGQLLEAAKNRARAIVNAASNADEFNIITTDLNASFMHFRGKQATLDNLDKIKLSLSSRPISDILEIQNRLLKDRNGEKLSYLISDFQKK
ncbi:MAG: BatA and WFA domain-containing protein, partial [Bacteroidetes bacterium]|nr:BatA and WFA domain-containing protein [Bacteroidota bacterium]